MTRPALTYADRAQLNEIGCVRPGNTERDAALDALRAKLVAVQRDVLAVHRTYANLCDAVVGIETAIADVDFEKERVA